MAKPASVLATDTFLTWRTRYNTLLGQVPEVVVTAAAPTANDDITNYENGTLWIDTSATPNTGYLLVDNTDTAAVWAVVGVADLSVSTAKIQDNAVTLAKIQDIATDSFLGRNTAGSGDPEVLNNATAKAMLDLSGTNSGDQTITLTGQVTGSGTGSFAASLAAAAITGQTDIGAAIVGTDEMIISDAGVLRKTAMSRIATYAQGALLHDSFSDFVPNEHLDWTVDLGAVNLHANNSANGVLALTSGEVTQLANIGATTITASNWTAVGNLSGTNTGNEVAATTTVSGIIELATQAEVDAGSDTVRAITPATLAGYANFPQGGLAPTYKTANYTAVDGDFVIINSGGVARTITLPATIASGNRIAIHHFNTSATEVLVTVARNGKTIRYQGTSTGDDITLADGETVELVATDTTNWEIV